MNSLEYIEKLEDPLCLLSINEEIMALHRDELISVLEKEGGHRIAYGITTKELIDGLTTHISSYINAKSPVEILELYAGNGSLTHHLQSALDAKYKDQFICRAADNGIRKCKNKLPIVEPLTDIQAMAKYPNTKIIIASWLHRHPFNFLPIDIFMAHNELSKKYNNKTITPLEENSLRDIQGYIKSLLTQPDITSYWRKNKKLQEYILIGPVRRTGDITKTHGLVSLEDRHSKVPKPLFEKDGFVKTQLDIPTISYDNMLGLTHGVNVSEIYSFKRTKTNLSKKFVSRLSSF